MRIRQTPQRIVDKLAKILSAIDESKSSLSLKAIHAKGIKEILKSLIKSCLLQLFLILI